MFVLRRAIQATALVGERKEFADMLIGDRLALAAENESNRGVAFVGGGGADDRRRVVGYATVSPAEKV